MNCIHEAIRVDNIEMLRILYPMIGERGNERDLSRVYILSYLYISYSIGRIFRVLTSRCWK